MTGFVLQGHICDYVKTVLKGQITQTLLIHHPLLMLFLSSAEHRRYFEERETPNCCWQPLTSIVFLFSII